MLAVQLTCPHCSRRIRSRQAPVPSQRLVCPGCDRPFVMSPNGATAPPGSRSPELAAAETANSSPAGATAPAPRRGLLLAIVVGGLAFLIGSTVLAVSLASRSDSKQTAQTTGDAERSQGLAAPEQRVAAAESATVAGPSAGDRPEQLDDPGKAPPAADAAAAPPEPKPPVVAHRGSPRTPVADAPASPPPLRAAPGAPKESAERAWLPRDVQTEVNKSIDRGVAYLKGKQHGNGSWETQFPTALAALPALTLLECGVPASDPRIQKAATFVRNRARKIQNRHTYQVSLALLFLDRLGEEKDRPLIRSLALRLVAGQNPDGGWNYDLPVLTTKEENALEKFLQQTRPQGLGRLVQLPDGRRIDPVVLRPDGQKPLDQGSAPGQGNRPGSGGKQSTGQGNSQGAKQSSSSGTGNGAGNKPSVPELPRKEKESKKLLTEPEARKEAAKLPARLRIVPAVVDATNPASVRASAGRRGFSDNSNTQFATLALWAATRYGLPLERTLDTLARRFKNSQWPDGTWGYHAAAPHGSPAMTGAGLLGLAVGHGISAGTEKIKDPQVEKGFHALSAHVGKALGADKKMRPTRRGAVRSSAAINLYFLWTIERVGVLYGVRTLDGKDWYRWGVELLVDAQKTDGSWAEGNYPGATRAIDTCLALLFLKRANLATDLTRKLEFVIDGKSAMGKGAAGGSLGKP
jgi:hypothetical protein